MFVLFLFQILEGLKTPPEVAVDAIQTSLEVGEVYYSRCENVDAIRFWT